MVNAENVASARSVGWLDKERSVRRTPISRILVCDPPRENDLKTRSQGL
jgi:hypothetical protein